MERRTATLETLREVCFATFASLATLKNTCILNLPGELKTFFLTVVSSEAIRSNDLRLGIENDYL